VVRQVAARNGRSASQIAIAWTLRNRTVTSPITGARTLTQLEDNLGALDVEFSDQDVAELEQVSAIELGFPHDFLNRPMTRTVTMGDVRLEPAPSPR
jgi:aryl-alcohol dehydrogenase-like predicted oxidoreductase